MVNRRPIPCLLLLCEQPFAGEGGGTPAFSYTSQPRELDWIGLEDCRISILSEQNYRIPIFAEIEELPYFYTFRTTNVNKPLAD